MFAMDWITALITFVITAVLYFYIYYRKPEANWGSSAQAQTFVNALKGVQNLTVTKDHVKNYRPKVLVLIGNPASRPSLVDFANLITKKLSLLICGHIVVPPGSLQLATLKENAQAWLNERKIKGFYSVTESLSIEEGAKACLNLAGLGKLSPNMLLLGFKCDWFTNVLTANEYFNVLQAAFDMNYSVGVLRLENGLDFSEHIKTEETMIFEQSYDGSVTMDNNNTREETLQETVIHLQSGTASAANANVTSESAEMKRKAVVRIDNENLPTDVASALIQFQSSKRSGNIDVWWLYDDGGLTLLLPYIFKTRQQFSSCKLRVFTLANKKEELDRETRNMAALLAKFRIEFSAVIVITDITKRACDTSRARLDRLIAKLPEGTITEEERVANKEKSNRHMRLSELLQEHSKQSEMIFLTLPLPRKGQVSAPLYLAWLDVMTADLPPTLLIRGNQTSVLTFYS